VILRPGRTGRFIRGVWRERYGESASEWPGADMTCDGLGCVLERDGQRVVFAFSDAVLAEDCGNAHLTISLSSTAGLCRSGNILDRGDFARQGTTAIWLTEDGLRFKTAAEEMGNRAWNRSSSTEPETEALNSGAAVPPDAPAP